MQLNTDKGKALLYFEKLLYIRASEIDSRDKIIRLQNGEEYAAKNITFKKLISVFPKHDFCRINKKEIIALKIIQAFSFNEITSNLKDNAGKNLKFSLSEIYREEFLGRVDV
ncbi:MAG: hypothetical protein KF900_08275 [Bacteroidetes bacterium]|nr:hypothetical protein [Bacteroidota bacterium]